MSKEWTYGGFDEKYDMTGEIHVGTGILKVHDIFNKMPDFMYQADILFVDPPGGGGCLGTYYTKAGIEKKARPYEKFTEFEKRLFDVIAEINPKIVVIELFNNIKASFEKHLCETYKYVQIANSTFYHNQNCVCYIAVASNEPIPDKFQEIEGMDEEDVIEFICKNIDFECIADPCMGQGLVAYFANKYSKKFVGTELNKKRLAVCVERVTTGKKKVM